MQIIKILFLGLLISANLFGQNDDWYVKYDSTDQCGYVNKEGEIMIPLGKYNMCFTDTLHTFAIVSKVNYGFIAINKNENILYHVFPFDNGPDYPSDGFFRILKNNKIGYADEVTGKIVIKPRFDCAYPFENGVAKVGFKCTSHAEGEHHYWTNDNWFTINKKGKKVE